MNSLLKYLLFIALVSASALSYAADAPYEVSVIPAALLKKANAVVRNAHYEINIVSAHEVHVIEKYAITILNDKGAAYGKVSVHENSFINIKSIKGRLYDKYGNELQELKKKDISVTAPYSYGSVSDIYYHNFDFHYGGYPYTCEYEIETVQDMTFYFPAWQPQEGHDCSVESAAITVSYPKELSLRYHTFHIPVAPVYTSTGQGYVLKAFVKDIPATNEADEFSAKGAFHLPAMIFAAEQFELMDENGSMASWKDLGAFVYHLNAGRDMLPDDVKKTVHQLTDTCTTTPAKINLLYDYLKKNTRYVGIQLGIGGWQTFDAQYVAEKGYGDCKALSNYMKSLLKEAGINAYQALVYAGSSAHIAMMPDFPCPMFNHVILCVPGKTDSTWIECTSKSLPAGYLSSFTDNRNVLLLTEAGGFMIRTPRNNTAINTLSRSAAITVDKDQLKGAISMGYGGYLWEKEMNVNDIARSDIGNYLNNKLRNGSFTVEKCNVINNISSSVPEINEIMDIKGDGNISDNGTHVFLMPYIFSNMLTVPVPHESLKGSFVLHHSYSISDTLTYQLAGNYSMDNYEHTDESIPFASYHYTATLDNNTVKVTYSYQQKEGSYPLALYPDYVKLYKEINTDCSSKLVLSRKD